MFISKPIHHELKYSFVSMFLYCPYMMITRIKRRTLRRMMMMTDEDEEEEKEEEEASSRRRRTR